MVLIPVLGRMARGEGGEVGERRWSQDYWEKRRKRESRVKPFGETQR